MQGYQFQPRGSDHKSGSGSNNISSSKSEGNTTLSEVDNGPKRPVSEWNTLLQNVFPVVQMHTLENRIFSNH